MSAETPQRWRCQIHNLDFDGPLESAQCPECLLSPEPKPWDECECEHWYEDHPDGDQCEFENAVSGSFCSCPSFKRAE